MMASPAVPILRVDKTPVRRAFNRPSPLSNSGELRMQGLSISSIPAYSSPQHLQAVKAAKTIDSLIVPTAAPSPRSALSRGLSSDRGHLRILSSDSNLQDSFRDSNSPSASLGSARKRLADSLVAAGEPVSHMQSAHNAFAIHSPNEEKSPMSVIQNPAVGFPSSHSVSSPSSAGANRKLNSRDSPSQRLKTPGTPGTPRSSSLRPHVPKRIEPTRELLFPPREGDSADLYSAARTTQQIQVDGEVTTYNPNRDGGFARPSTSPIKGVSKSLADFKMLAAACQRSGRTRQEGQAYYKMAVLYENKGLNKQSLECYERFLAIARRLQDFDSEVLALNCLGILCQRIGGAEYIERALEYHAAHLQLEDHEGRYAAHVNIGLAHMSLAAFDRAQHHFKEALQYAIRLENIEGESVALANLAKVSKVLGDVETAKACIERRVELAGMLNDNLANSESLSGLADFAMEDGDPVRASAFFDQARNNARHAGDVSAVKRVSVKLGISVGNSQFEDLVRQLGSQMRNSP
ncbi:conserved mitochondrial TPR domain-containing protein [Andalucia godoyi]|uniref:Tetratricopeptide repeat protein 29 n=1 Tax=Andalucia godoyi TaxID=505711 RepID=A0A8K0AIN4_ANDGO|nr:conserved mitochondrial TPR domain-containing protein [Andalucia godoyi]|eukprot:ANDGO_01087.mRNA.1 conserved mitochondrial TPR domain-containing protein